jgi:hypothetical protein
MNPQCPIHGYEPFRAPCTCEDAPKKNLVDRAVEQIWFAGGLIAMMIVCTIGFAVASCLGCLALLGIYWLLSRPLVWLFGW